MAVRALVGHPGHLPEARRGGGLGRGAVDRPAVEHADVLAGLPRVPRREPGAARVAVAEQLAVADLPAALRRREEPGYGAFRLVLSQ